MTPDVTLPLEDTDVAVRSPFVAMKIRIVLHVYWVLSLNKLLSRICVKNLPKHVAEERLRDFFSQKGEVTDAKLMITTDGKSRQFAFIGYRTEQEAKEAIKYFNKSYLDTSRIICENSKATEKKGVSEKESRKTLASVDVDSDETDIALDENETKASDNVARNDVISDMDYFKSRVKKDWSDSESDDSKENDDGDLKGKQNSSSENVIQDQIQEYSSKDFDGEILDPGNPSSGVKDDRDEVLESDELTELFSKFGDLSQVHLVIYTDTKHPRELHTFFTRFQNVQSGEVLVQVLLLGPISFWIDDSANQGSKSFKQKREEERKASEASGDTRARNSLFMRLIQLLKTLLGNMVNQNSLTNSGVNISSLEEIAAGKMDGRKRSNHVLLVKNLPYGSSEGELAKMFGKLGSLDMIILPPTKLWPWDVPLYLEWAPDNVLNKSSASVGDKKNDAAVGEHDVKRSILEQQVEGISDVDIDPDRIENLNFKTTEESLKNHVTELVKEGRIKSIRIIIWVKKHMKNGKQVSMGYGFIEFDSVETASNVCRDLQGTILDGHALILQLCHAKKEQAVKNVEKDKSSTKLLVRNVAFEATEKDLRQLFSPFGQIKSLRLPMKYGNHRGARKSKRRRESRRVTARTAAQFTNEENGYQNPARLSKRKNGDILDDGG
ncbi:multiple RNA-binding domain-containing protein 1-like isoform X3 [Hibiscus syriacus]|uniref:Multiple RNA-binding domain-containing protein 1-like isoform X3 n=1 Tax=Hibiscus syriacus TaxID=106335 RepID=A0A6A3AVZ6_HIBSY|nr:multiple RNA-binding domain-containing protein 1-like isoform X3 [Hibiscus syriacus]